jgi:alanine dehydrogenase
MKNKVLLLSSSDIKKLYSMEEAIKVIEKAFKDFNLGKSKMPSKIYLDIPEYKGDFRAMPAYIISEKIAGLKWVNSHPFNPKKGFATVFGMLILSDPRNGLPLAVMDATRLTSIRTGAGGGVAIRHLANKKVYKMALIGAGVQAYYQTLAAVKVRQIPEIHFYDISTKCRKSFRKQIAPFYTGKIIESKNIKSCVCNADIIITTTGSHQPIIFEKWITPGTHINAIGADAKGKQELDPAILKKSKIIVDEIDQACHSGEINVPLQKRIISKNKITATLGQVITKTKIGRKKTDEITVFDSTGLAIQDMASASFIYKKALKSRKIATFNFID